MLAMMVNGRHAMRTIYLKRGGRVFSVSNIAIDKKDLINLLSETMHNPCNAIAKLRKWFSRYRGCSSSSTATSSSSSSPVVVEINS